MKDQAITLIIKNDKEHPPLARGIASNALTACLIR